MRSRPPRRERRRTGWLVHVIVDVALGIGLVIAGLHGHGAGFLVLDAAGAYLILVTLVTDGLGGVLRVLPRAAHRVLDGLVALCLLASPLLLWRLHDPVGAFATAMAEAVGVILLRDALVSDHRVVVRGIDLSRSSTTIDVHARVVRDGDDRPAPPARQEKSGPVVSATEAARRAGVAAGRAKRYGKAAHTVIRKGLDERS